MSDVPERLRSALADRYTVERELGRGGMATVYLATDRRHNRPVAVKVLRPEIAQSLGTERFLREIQIAAQLSHPHILALHDSGEADGYLYYVMPYVKGESLRDRLRREKQLPVADALGIAREVAEAVAHAHSCGIVHRDLKPENILLSGGHAVVADFGIALALTAAGGEKLTETGLAIGTPAYMSPEQAVGNADVDARTDVYSLGCVLYEMLIGDPPFTGATPQVILARKAIEAVASLHPIRETVSASLDGAVTKALARVPADRFLSGQEFLAALDRVGVDDAVPAPLLARLWPRHPLHRSFAVTATVLVLGVAGMAVQRAIDAGLGGAGARALPSAAVLPIVNQTGDPGNDYLSDGITEELINRLAGLPGLQRVPARASVFSYKGRTVDPGTVADDLDVAAVVTGWLARRDSIWTLGVEVTDARNGRHLWGTTYDLTGAQLVSVTDRLVPEITQALRLEVPDALLGPPAGGTQDPEARRLVLLGNYLGSQMTEASMAEAVEHYERALDLDPGYALAWSHLGQLYCWMALYGLDEPATFRARAVRAATRGAAADSRLAQAHVALAYIHLIFEWDWSAAEREFQRALQLEPRSAGILREVATFLSAMDRVDEAIELIERGRELDPLSSDAYHAVAWTYTTGGRHARAVEEFERAIALFPTFAPNYSVMAWSLNALGRRAEALAAAERSEQLRGGAGGPLALATLGYVYAKSGREDRARANLARLRTLAGERYIDPILIAIVYSGLGDREHALEWLERAYEVRSPELIFKGDGREWFPDLLDDPRYQALASQMNFPPS